MNRFLDHPAPMVVADNISHGFQDRPRALESWFGIITAGIIVRVIIVRVIIVRVIIVRVIIVRVIIVRVIIA